MFPSEEKTDFVNPCVRLFVTDRRTAGPGLMMLTRAMHENNKLETVCKYFNIEIENAHDAMVDIKATKLLAEKIDNSLRDIKI